MDKRFKHASGDSIQMYSVDVSIHTTNTITRNDSRHTVCLQTSKEGKLLAIGRALSLAMDADDSQKRQPGYRRARKVSSS